MSYLVGKMLLCLFLAALIGLIVGWLLRRFGAVKRELELNGEIDVQNDRVGSLEGQLGERDGKIMSLGADLSSLQSKVPGLESTLAERDDQVMALTMDVDTWKQKLPSLEAQLSDVETQRTSLASDLADSAKSLQEQEGQVGRLTGEVSSLRKQLGDVNERSALEASEFTAELTSQKQQMDAVRNELQTANTAHLLEKDVAAALTVKAASLQTDMDALKKHSDSLTGEGREREQALNELRQSLKAQEAERLSLAEQVTTLSPVALRVKSQDQSIASLNQDLRTRDTTIHGLQGQLQATQNQAEELQSSEHSLGLLRAELDGMRSELTTARSVMSSAAQSSVDAEAVAQAKAGSNDKEWRIRLRIAESGKQQAQADLYRRQEQIERLQRQLSATQAEVQNAAPSQLQTTPFGLVGSAGSASSGTIIADTVAAGTIAATDERQWKTQLRIAESARRNAEAEVARQNDRVQSLEAQLRDARKAAAAKPLAPEAGSHSSTTKVGATETGVTTAAARSAVSAASTPPTPPKPPTPAPPRAPVNTTATSSAGVDATRFMTEVPTDQDDLRKIEGVGKVLVKTLNSLGIFQFRQVALFSADDVAWVDDRLKFKGRIERDEWVEQAALLHNAKYGSTPSAD